MLSKEVSSTIFKVFGMTWLEIEPRSPEPLANTLPTGPITAEVQSAYFTASADKFYDHSADSKKYIKEMRFETITNPETEKGRKERKKIKEAQKQKIRGGKVSINRSVYECMCEEV